MKLSKYSWNCCPNCGATDPDIEWGDKDWADTSAWQNATCKKCGCEFEETYIYQFSEYEPVNMDLETDEEIEEILNPKNDSEDWPEFEIIKDGVVEFMSDLPIEIYEKLYKATQQKQKELIEHLLKFGE